MTMGETLKGLLAQDEIPYAQLTPDVLKLLLNELQTLTPTEQEANLQKLLTKAHADVYYKIKSLKIELNTPNLGNQIPALDSTIEVLGSIEYSIDGLKKHVSKDEKAKAFLDLYQLVIAKDLATIYGANYETGLGARSKNTIQLVFWNIIQSQLGIKGVMSAGKGLLPDFTNIFGKVDGEATGSILTVAFTEREEALGKIGSIDDETTEKVSGIIDIVESLIGKQANNLDTLLKATSSMTQAEKAKVFDNPQIVEAVMNTGKYNENGFDIDITEDPAKVSLGNTSKVENVQALYMSDLQKDTENLGGRIDKIRALKTRADDFLAKVGMEGGLDELMKTLYKIPILGMFFEMIFGDFFNQFDALENLDAIDDILSAIRNPKATASLKTLRDTFIPDFIKNYEGKKDTAIGKLIIQDKAFSPEFYNGFKGEGKFFSILEDAGINPDTDNFWDQILMGKTTAGSPEKHIHSKLAAAGILGNGEITEETISGILNNINAEELKDILNPPVLVPFTDISVGAPADGTAAPVVAPADRTAAPVVTPADRTATPVVTPANRTAAPVVAPADRTAAPDGTAAPEVIPADGTVAPVVAPADGTVAPVVAPEEVITTVLSLADQIANITSLPTTLQIEGKGPLTISDFDNSSSSIELNGQKYTILLKARPNLLLIPMISQVIQGFDISQNRGILNIDTVENPVAIKPEDLLSLLTGLIESGNFRKEDITPDGKYKYLLEIK